MAARVHWNETADTVGRLDPYHAYRSGYGQGAWDVLSALGVLLDEGVDLETAMEELRAWLLGPDVHQWVNAPGDPHEIVIGDWLARRRKTVKQHV